MGFGFDPRALRERVPRRLVSSYLLSLIGDLMVLAAMPITVAAVGGGPKEIGFALAAQGFAVVVALPVGGVVGDRVSRRTVMIAADLTRVGSQAVIAILLIAGEATVWQLIVAQAIHGVATGFFMPAAEAIIPEAVGDEAVQPTNGTKQAAWSIAWIVGPALGALVVAASGPGWAMAADGATFLASAVLLAGVPAVRPSKVDDGRGLWTTLRVEFWADLREGWRAFRSRPWMASVVLQWTLVNALAIAPFFVLGPVLSEEQFGGTGAWAVMLMALGVGEWIGSIRATSWRPERPLVAGLSLTMLWAIPAVLVAMPVPLPVVAGGLAAAGFGLATFDTLWRTTVQTQVPPEQRARVTSFDLFGSLAVVPLGFMLGAWIASAIGASAGLVGGAVFLIASTLLVLALPSVRGLRAVTTGRKAG